MTGRRIPTIDQQRATARCLRVIRKERRSLPVSVSRAVLERIEADLTATIRDQARTICRAYGICPKPMGW